MSIKLERNKSGLLSLHRIEVIASGMQKKRKKINNKNLLWDEIRLAENNYLKIDQFRYDKSQP